ncbi:MAG TPA: DUF885 domain-containing protein, partial [Usitatibacteraceae bacterium]|nr:DUF885 domain-containing protein [Usitatibacteraceae bacterium]
APEPALHALFEREFLRGQEEFPEFATMIGNPAFNDRLHDGSPEAVARRKAHVKAVLADLGRFDPKRLSTQDRISLEMMKDSLRRRDELNALFGDLPFGAGRGDGWMQVSPSSGPQVILPMLARAAPFRDARDYENYLKRLEAVPRVLAESRVVMEAGIESGWMPPRAAMSQVPGQLAVFSGGDATATPLYAPFRQFPAAVAAQDRARLAEAARITLAQRVQPAFAAFRRFVEEEYLPACRDDLAASTLPAGAAYYRMMIATMTTTDLDAAQIHEIGKREVVRIRAEMDRVIASTGFKGSFAAFVQSIKTNPRSYHTSAHSMLEHYRDIAKRADAELPRFFAELPRLPYGIRPMPAYLGDNAEHYTPGALDGSRAGFFEANTNNLSRRARHDMEAVLLHEAVPGHHLQTARAQELKGLPSFRRASFYVAYGEGWALYAESLGEEMGLYADPLSKFGRLSMEMWRACRLVVDTGLHAFGWTREQSIRYLADTSGIDESAAIAEVDRYILDPGQALGYKIGELRIKALRAKAQQALGERFDLRRFHNAVLDDGALPLNLLDARIDEWIAREKAAR